MKIGGQFSTNKIIKVKKSESVLFSFVFVIIIGLLWPIVVFFSFKIVSELINSVCVVVADFSLTPVC